MFDKWRKYSYVAQKQRRLHILRALIWVFVFFLSFTVIGTLFVSTVVVENATMKPGVERGDRLVVSPFPYGARIPMLSFRLPGPDVPKRGDLVIVERSPNRVSNLERFTDSLLRFFSGQRLTPSRPAAPTLLLKRVLGVPGDTLAMSDHIVRIKPAGESYGLTEFELIKHPYDLSVPTLPVGWDDRFPFSGSMDQIVLGPDEYFLLSDDRSGADDSRVWGPVHLDSLVAKVLFRYWPVSRFGRP